MFNMKFRSSLYQWNPTEWFLYWKHFSSFARNPRFFQPWGYWNVKDGKYAEITGEILYMTWRNSHMIAQHFHHDIKRTARSLCVEPKQCRLNESQMIFFVMNEIPNTTTSSRVQQYWNHWAFHSLVSCYWVVCHSAVIP